MSQFISLQDAINMTTLYRAERENILAEEYREQNILSICETFDRDVFDIVLAQEGCKGLRVYYGMKENYQVHAIVVGVNENNEDMLPTTGMLPATENFSIIEEARRCPDDCPPPSDLNGE